MVILFLPYGSPIILVLLASNTFTKFRRGHPCGGVKYRWRIKISTNKSLYLANHTRYRHSYYGRRIGTSMRSIKWCQFQWPWTNPNPVFKLTPLFDAKYLTAIVTIEGEYETAPKLSSGTNFMTLSDLKPRFQGHDIIQRQTTRKRYKIEL